MDFKRNRGAWGFALFWSAFVLIFDAFVVGGLIEAVRSEGFDTTPGVVTKSEIKRGRKGSSSFELEYTYTVNGQPYTGTEYHVQPQFVGNGYWLAAHTANPVGTPVTVRFDPGAPHTAVLVSGLRPDVFLLPWCLAPFNLVAVLLMWSVWGQGRGFDPARERCVCETPGGRLVRPDPSTRFAVSVLGFLLSVSFVGFFVTMGYSVAFSSAPPWWVPLSLWIGALVSGVVVGWRSHRRGLVHINDWEGIVTFIHNGTWVTASRTDIAGVDVTTETRKRRRGSYEVITVALRWRDMLDQEQATRLAEYASAEDASAFRHWFSDRLGRPVAPRAEG